MRARDNPFRSEGIECLRYRLQGTTWPELLSRFQSLNHRGALVGRFGSGKTTLLENMAIELDRKGYQVRLGRAPVRGAGSGVRFVTGLTKGSLGHEVLLVDSAEQLRTGAWLLLKWRSRRAAGLVITTHKPGRLPTLWECSTSAGLLAELAGELLNRPPAQVSARAEALFKRHEGNLREAFREWYDLLGQTGTAFES